MSGAAFAAVLSTPSTKPVNPTNAEKPPTMERSMASTEIDDESAPAIPALTFTSVKMAAKIANRVIVRS